MITDENEVNKLKLFYTNTISKANHNNSIEKQAISKTIVKHFPNREAEACNTLKGFTKSPIQQKFIDDIHKKIYMEKRNEKLNLSDCMAVRSF